MEVTGRCTVKLLLFLSLFAVLLGAVPAKYSITDCESGNIIFLEDTQPTLECTGMNKGQTIYWSVNDTEDNEVRIGDCYKNNTCSPVTNSDYNLTRPAHNQSVLKIQDNIRQKDGYTMTCSQRNNETKAFCKLYFIWGPLEVSVRRKKVMNTMMLTCSVDDVNPGANFTWTGVDCDNQSRTENNTVSVCVFKPTNADSGKMVTCTATNVVDNSLNASATFRIEHEEPAKAFPTTAIAGGAGAVAVIIVVIIVALVILSRRKKRAAEGNQMINDREEGNEPERQTYDKVQPASLADNQDYTELTVSAVSSAERQTYDKLQPASLADNQDYTELTVSTVSSGLQNQDARQTYERLQPDLAADNRNYTALNVSGVMRGQRSQDNVYHNAALESNYSTGPSYTKVEGATSTSETRSDRHGNNMDVPQDEPATDGVYETTELS